MSITQDVLQKFGKKENEDESPSGGNTEQDDLDLSEPFKMDANGELLGVPVEGAGKFGESPGKGVTPDDYNRQVLNQSQNTSLNQSRSKKARRTPTGRSPNTS